MENLENFTKELFEVFDEKVRWYETEELPKMLEEYRKLHAYVGNVYTTLLKKSTITADPYKLEKKISEIKPISDKPFSESERNVVIGTRLSDYESMLDFICNYLTFSISNIKADRIKKLVDFNNGFHWNSVIATSVSPNTKGLSDCLIPIRQGTDALATSVLNDSLSNAAKTVEIINGILKEFADFQREVYKSVIIYYNEEKERNEVSSSDDEFIFQSRSGSLRARSRLRIRFFSARQKMSHCLRRQFCKTFGCTR